MTHARDTWLMLCDHRRARLIHVESRSHGALQLRETDAIEDTGVEHEHSRPMALGSRAAGAYASTGHEGKELERRFADEIVHWARQMSARYEIERLVIFALAHLLGALRLAWPKHLVSEFDLHEGEYATMRLAELYQHPAICDAVGCSPLPR